MGRGTKTINYVNQQVVLTNHLNHFITPFIIQLNLIYLPRAGTNF